jgi:hypothetical protein
MKFIYLFLLLALISSCTIHSGLITSGNSTIQPNTKVEYIDKAVGYSKVSYFLGIGGLSKDMMIEEAKRNMMICNPLKPNQSYQNQTLQFKKTIFGPYFRYETIIVSDIIEFDSSYSTTYSEKYLNLINKNLLKTYGFFNLGEEVLFYDKNFPIKEGKIVGLDAKGATIFYTQQKGAYRIRKGKYDRIYKTKDMKELMDKIGLKEQENYTFSADNIIGYNVTGKGTIVGLNEKFALIQSKKIIYIAKIQNLIKNNPK